MKKIISLLIITVLLTACDAAQSIMGAYSLTQCEYKYNSISGLNLAGVNLQNVNSIASLNPMTAASLVSAFSKSSVPLQFTLNLNVKNPGSQTALLNGLQYVLEIDDVQMTTGSLDSKLQVGAGQTSVLPINLAFDLKKVMSGQSADAIKNMAYNFVGLGSSPSNVTIKLKPTIAVGAQTITSPAYIPVTFTYGKGNK